MESHICVTPALLETLSSGQLLRQRRKGASNAPLPRAVWWRAPKLDTELKFMQAMTKRESQNLPLSHTLPTLLRHSRRLTVVLNVTVRTLDSEQK